VIARTPGILGFLALASMLVVWLLPPIAQSEAYHGFADTRAAFGVPNAWNVLSNVPFLFAGAWGLAACARRPGLPARAAWIVAFAGIALVAAGSAWYHLAPSNATLVWDRLPMTIGFMGLLAAVLARPLGERTARAMLVPAVAIGIASVVFWDLTGDLRPYVWVQFMPLLLVAAILVVDPPPGAERRALGAAIVLYGLAKVFELLDPQIYAALGGLAGGHALKHLAAAAACAALVGVVRAAPPS
jgi:ceramidase